MKAEDVLPALILTIISVFIVIGIMLGLFQKTTKSYRKMNETIDRCELTIDRLSTNETFQKAVSTTTIYHYLEIEKDKFKTATKPKEQKKAYHNYLIYYNRLMKHYSKLKHDKKLLYLLFV